jgi:hypothetical protein
MVLSDIVNGWDYVASNDKMIREWWTRKDVEGSDLSLIWGSASNVYEGAE